MRSIALTLLAAVATAAPTTPSHSKRWWNEDNSSLAAQAIAAGKKYFGNAWQSFYRENQNFSTILEAQFNQYTFENEMKWEVIQPSRGVYNWTGADLIVAEAKRTNSLLRGHNFCWDSQTPTYVTNITDASELKQVLQEHINAVLGRYASDLYAFDVVNEPLNDNGTYKSNVWYNVLGESYIATALEYTRAAAPDLKLYINDYNIEGVNNKSIAMAEVARGLLAQGAPLDGIGFESHFIGGSTPPDIAQSMKMFTDQGLDVAITELDVRVPINNFGTPVNSTWFQVQADDYANVTQTCLDNDKCVGITVWGFSDDRSWIPGVFAGQGAADLYDLYYQPKPALGAVQGVLAGGKK